MKVKRTIIEEIKNTSLIPSTNDNIQIAQKNYDEFIENFIENEKIIYNYRQAFINENKNLCFKIITVFANKEVYFYFINSASYKEWMGILKDFEESLNYSLISDVDEIID